MLQRGLVEPVVLLPGFDIQLIALPILRLRLVGDLQMSHGLMNGFVKQ